MADHAVHRNVEVTDGDRVVASAQVDTSPEAPDTVRACRRRFGRAHTGYLWCVAVARPLPRSGPTGTLRVGRRAWPRSTRQLLLHQRTAGWGGPPGRRTRRWNGCAGVRSRASDVLFAGHIWAGNRLKVEVLLGVTPAPEAQRPPAKSRLAGGAVVFGAGTGAAGVTRPSPAALTRHGPSRHPLPTPPAVGGGTFSPGGASPPPPAFPPWGGGTSYERAPSPAKALGWRGVVVSAVCLLAGPFGGRPPTGVVG